MVRHATDSIHITDSASAVVTRAGTVAQEIGLAQCVTGRKVEGPGADLPAVREGRVRWYLEWGTAGVFAMDHITRPTVATLAIGGAAGITIGATSGATCAAC